MDIMERPMVSKQLASQPAAIINNCVRNLPLYDTLLSNLTDRANQENFSITPEYKNKLCTVLNSLDPPRATEIALLLIHYYFLVNPNSNPFTINNCNSKTSSRSNFNALPYGIKISSSGKGFSFDIDTLPIPFQALLGTYCRI